MTCDKLHGRFPAGAFRLLGTVVLLSALSACNVPAPPGSTGAGEAGSCPATLVTLESDYASTNVALVAMDGTVLTSSLASSATAGLGGDVVVPASPSTGRVVLIDRLPEARLTFIDKSTAKVSFELSVATGFPSNPHDYAEVLPGKAYVTRYDENLAAGKQPLDRGSDVLVVDTVGRALTASIDMRPAVADAKGVLPRPDRMATSGGRVFVLLGALTASYVPATSSRIVEIDPRTDAVVGTLVLPGLEGCAGLTRSPVREELAVLCSGNFRSTGPSALDGSGVALVDVSGPPSVTRIFPATTFGQAPIGFYAAYAGADSLVIQTFGHLSDGVTAAADDVVYRLDLRTFAHEEILRSQGEPFTLGGIACEPGCGACFVADAGRGGVLHRFDVDASGALSAGRAITVERKIGLPPVELGTLR